MIRISEPFARVLALGLLVGVMSFLGITRWAGGGRLIEIHASTAEEGGWTPADITARVGEPLHIRLTADDVPHSFAIGQSDQPPVAVSPGQSRDLVLIFDQPGRYTYYCTQWCSPNHWRMRGAIEVAGGDTQPAPQDPPLYVSLGIDIDADHPAAAIPDRPPSAARGAALDVSIPPVYRTQEYYRSHSPVQLWQALHDEPSLAALTGSQVWDLVASIWQSHTTPQALQEGQRLYAENCAACHGETGQGDGTVVTPTPEGHRDTSEQKPPTDFTDPETMLGASPALLQGKILRGGMGTGMPYWGPIFTGEQTWALVAYLWTFQFQH